MSDERENSSRLQFSDSSCSHASSRCLYYGLEMKPRLGDSVQCFIFALGGFQHPALSCHTQVLGAGCDLPNVVEHPNRELFNRNHLGGWNSKFSKFDFVLRNCFSMNEILWVEENFLGQNVPNCKFSKLIDSVLRNEKLRLKLWTL